jgi:phosphoglycerate dehydrogenase-like enzyme
MGEEINIDIRDLKMSEPVNVLITVPFPEKLISKLNGVSPRLRISVSKAKNSEEISDEEWDKAEVLYTSRILPAPQRAPHLRWIQFHFAGIDHAVDAPILKKEDLVATTLSGASASQMAEYVVMMLLSLGHRLPELVNSQKRAEWPKDRWERFSPQELRESKVGIVGYGSIGRQVARLLAPFGVQVLASKRDAMHPEDHGYTPEGQGDPQGDFVRRLYPPQALKSMIKACDFIVVTIPLTEETRGMMNAEAFNAFKPTAFLVDVSRGGVVDHEALIEALNEKKLAGAALDVFPEEPLSAESPLWKMPNVFITPHIAGNTAFYDERAVELFAENLDRYLSGLPLYNRYRLELGY